MYSHVYLFQIASRRAFQAAGLIFVVCGLVGKFGAVLTLLPSPVLGGIVLVSFGMVTSVGLSNLQFVSLKSSRNLVIIGTSLILGLMIPKYLGDNPGCIKTGTRFRCCFQLEGHFVSVFDLLLLFFSNHSALFRTENFVACKRYLYIEY